MNPLEIVALDAGLPAVHHLAEEARWEEAFALLDRLAALANDPIDAARVKLGRVATMNDLDWTGCLRDPALKHRLLDDVAPVVDGVRTDLHAETHFQRGMALHLEFIMAEGDPERELACFTRAAELYASVGAEEGCALATAFVGIYHHVDRLDREAAYPVLRKAYESVPAGRGSEARSEAARHLGQIHQERGDYRTAIGFLEESLAARAESGASRHLASALHALGFAHLEAGDLDRAEEYLDRARLLGERYPSRLFLPMIAKAEADLAFRRVVGPNVAGRTHP